METNQIQSVLMGAHKVFTKNNELLKFINTSGSNMIIKEAENNKIPVFLIAEKRKTEEWKKDSEEKIKYEEDHLITRQLKQNENLDTIEIAYDLCDRNK